MGNKDIELSVIIPVYNAAYCISRCLDSIIQQKLKDKIEIICVDDGSTDNSLEILKDYEQKYNFLHVISQTNQYAGVARNNGLDKAKGKYIHFLDADDYCTPGIYEKCIAQMHTYNIEYLRFRCYVFDFDTEAEIDKDFFTMKDVDQNLFGITIQYTDCPDVFLSHARAPFTSIFSREFLINNHIRFNDLICVNDRSFYVKVICSAKRVFLLDDYGVYHQIHNKKSLMGIRHLHFDCHLISYKIIQDYLRNVDFCTKQQILGKELTDLLYWYQELDNTHKEKWRDKVKQFLKTLCFSELEEDVICSKDFLDVIDELSLNPLCSMTRIDNMLQIEKIMEKKKRIYLYGAGVIAQALLKELQDQKKGRFIISGVYVTEKGENPDTLMNVPVREIEERINDSCIIIATMKTLQLPIYFNLLSKGYEDIILLSDEFCNKLNFILK